MEQLPMMIPYTSVLKLAAEMSSRTYPPTTEQAGIFKTFITHYLRQVWERFAWPEVCDYQKEYFAQLWTPLTTYVHGVVVYYSVDGRYYQMIRAGTTLGVSGRTPTDKEFWAEATPNPGAPLWESSSAYAIGDQVDFGGVVFQCVAASPAGTTPLNPEFWGDVPPWFRFISKTLDRVGALRSAEIGEFFQVTEDDPRTVAQATHVPFLTTSHNGTTGALVQRSLPFVWVRVRWAPPMTLADDSQIPARFSEVVALRTAASMFRTDGKSDQATEVEGLAAESLAIELDKAVTHESQMFDVQIGAR